jgi:hypothetical protein
MELRGGSWFGLKSGSYFLRDPKGKVSMLELLSGVGRCEQSGRIGSDRVGAVIN